LYYYGARYYDANIGRFISPDSIVPNPANPQSLNRYSYCLNNPLKYIDPSGHESQEDYLNLLHIYGIGDGTAGDNPISLDSHPDHNFDQRYNLKRASKDKSIYSADLIISGGKAVIDESTETEVRMTQGLYAKLHKEGWTDEQIAEMANLQPYSTIWVSDATGETNTSSSFDNTSSDEIGASFLLYSGLGFIVTLHGKPIAIQYSDKVLRQMAITKDLYHSFSSEIDEMTAFARREVIYGNDGVFYQIRIKGSINGVPGYYRYIWDYNLSCNKRFFTPDW
jgi:hypothetical protein